MKYMLCSSVPMHTIENTPVTEDAESGEAAVRVRASQANDSN